MFPFAISSQANYLARFFIINTAAAEYQMTFIFSLAENRLPFLRFSSVELNNWFWQVVTIPDGSRELTRIQFLQHVNRERISLISLNLNCHLTRSPRIDQQEVKIQWIQKKTKFWFFSEANFRARGQQCRLRACDELPDLFIVLKSVFFSRFRCEIASSSLHLHYDLAYFWT